ncbi:unknown [Lactobacillus phage Lb338-1]|uniref:Uncharacterized protein n=1 Tax=Lactobacillus phage Lb338-1 TaxID=2892342 RepID=C1KFT2_9CAUD|nr:hypothetical protein lb338_phage_172 [Lactobacillus phage Lb338-1]ACO37093.1 unknown [Lactobacillus phage Lb338-1]
MENKMEKATDKQLRFMLTIRQALADYDEVIGGDHQLPSADEVWSMSKADAGKFISKYGKAYKECLAKLLESKNN